MRRRISDENLARLKALPLRVVLEGLGLYVTRDRDFKPVGNPATCRLYASQKDGFQFELVVTEPLWYDPRAKKGGKGAIDLVIHITDCNFKEAVARLISIDGTCGRW